MINAFIIYDEKISSKNQCETLLSELRKKKKTQFWIDSETDNVFGDMFEEDERAWTLEYLEWSWKRLYRNHYNLGLFDPITGPYTLSYNDFVSLSRGTL